MNFQLKVFLLQANLVTKKGITLQSIYNITDLRPKKRESNGSHTGTNVKMLNLCVQPMSHFLLQKVKKENSHSPRWLITNV